MTADGAMAIAILMARVSNFPWPDDGSKHEGWVQILAAPCNSDIRDDIAVATAARMLTEYSPEKLSPAQIVERCRSRPEIPKKHRSLPPPEDASGPALRRIYFPPDNGREPYPVAHPDEAERERFRRYYAKSAAHPALLAARPDLGITEEHLEAGAIERLAEEELAQERIADLEAQSTLTDDEKASLRAAQARLDAARLRSREPALSPLRPVLAGVLTRLGARMNLACGWCGEPLSENGLRAYVEACMEAGKRNLTEPPRRCGECAA